MKQNHEKDGWPEFLKLKKKIEQACTIRNEKIFTIDDSLSNIKSFRDLEITNGLSPAECINRGKKFLAENQFVSSISEFNIAANGLDRSSPLWGELFFYRAEAYFKRGMKAEAARDYSKASAHGFDKTTISVYEIKTIGKRVKAGIFLVEEKRPLYEWTRAQRAAAKADKFFHEYAKILWYHFQDEDPVAARDIADQSKAEILSELETYLFGLKSDFSKKRAQQIKQIVSDELDRLVKPTKNKTPFISTKDKPESERRREHENNSLASILELYRTYTDVKSKRQIQYNMAIVLDAVNFWSERMPGKGKRVEKYIRRLKSRWIDVERIALNIKNGLKFLEDQNKVCPLEVID